MCCLFVVVDIVIGAYRDATKLVQRLKEKRSGTEGGLPEKLARELEDSLALGCLAVQSQYDHDVRRFGETYARGDAVAREQMKDILITLQLVVVSHLREVYMDDAALDIHVLKETSDDSRVNATVCLGQLYQRMSTATAAVKQISRTYLDEPDNSPPSRSLAYSSSRSTHSSYENRSMTSYSTADGRTVVGHDRKESGATNPRRRTSLTSAISYSSGAEPPKSINPGEDNVPAQPYYIRGQTSHSVADNESTSDLQHPENDVVHSSPTVPPLPRPHRASQISVTNDEQDHTSYVSQNKDQNPPLYVSKDGHPIPQGQKSSTYRDYSNTGRPDQIPPIHELDSSYNEGYTLPDSEGRQTTSKVPVNPRSLVPMAQAPDHSTLEHVSFLEAKSRPPADYLTQQQQQQHGHQFQDQQWPHTRDLAALLASNNTIHHNLTPEIAENIVDAKVRALMGIRFRNVANCTVACRNFLKTHVYSFYKFDEF
jgi:hypothetical protein